MSRRAFYLCLAVTMLTSLSFFFSAFIYREAISGSHVITDPDSVLFLRYFEQALAKGKIPTTDLYGAYPNSIEVKYPPLLLNFLVETTLVLMTFFPDHNWSISQAIGWIPPFFGWLVALLIVIYTWRKTQNKSLTLLAAFAGIPGLIVILNSQFLRIDYHFLNHLFIWVWIIAASLYVDEQRKTWLLIGTATATCFLLTWAGTPLFYLLVVIHYFILFLLRAPETSELGSFNAFAMFFSSILVIFYLLFTGNYSKDVGELGWIQPLSLFLGSVFIKGTLLLQQKLETRKKPIFFQGKTIALLFIVIAASFFVILKDQIINGLNLIFVSDLSMKNIRELQPGLDFSDVILSTQNLVDAIIRFGPLFFLFPLLYRFNPAGLFSGGGRLIRDFSLLFLLLSIHSARYYRWIGVIVGFWNGIALFYVFSLICNQTIGRRDEKKKRLAFALLPLMLLHFLTSYPAFFRSSPDPASTTMLSMKWIRENTPETSGYYDDKEPEYCFYNYYKVGNLLNYYARRPTLANCTMRGITYMARLFAAMSESEAYALCEKYRVKYFYLIAGFDLGDEMAKFYREYAGRPGVSEDSYTFFPEFVFKDEDKGFFAKTFHYWLSKKLALNHSGNFSQSASRLRIIYCLGYHSNYFDPNFLIFELVNGARIEGISDPGSPVKVSLQCRFHQMQKSYQQEVISDEKGKFSLQVPYANGYSNGNVSTAPHYSIIRQQNGQAVESTFVVSENDVKNGARLNLTSGG